MLGDDVIIEPKNNANVLKPERNANIIQAKDAVVELTSLANHDAPTQNMHRLPTLDMQKSFHQNCDQPADSHPHDSEGTKLRVDTSPSEVGAIEVMAATSEKEAKKLAPRNKYKIRMHHDRADCSDNKSIHYSQASALSDLNLVSLNVCGLQNKFNLGILDQFLVNYDLVFLSETNTDSPVLTDTLLNEYLCLSKEKVNANQKFRYGGINGVCILAKPDLAEIVEVIKDATSECI